MCMPIHAGLQQRTNPKLRLTGIATSGYTTLRRGFSGRFHMSPARPLLSTAVLLVAFLLSMTPHYCVGNEPGDTSAYIAWWTKYSSEEALRDALRKVPEVDLGIEAGESGTESGKLLQKYVAEINQKN